MTHTAQHCRAIIEADKDAETIMDMNGRLGGLLENMIQIRMQTYPRSWSEADKREMAIKHLGMES